jgi:sugar phosphate isomerase/epimerase
MKIGISTSSFYPLYTEEALYKIAENGVNVAEVFFNAECETEKPFVDKLKRVKESYGMEISSIHPTMSLCESFMLFSNYDRRYFEGLEKYKRYGEIAAELGAEYVIMHGGKPNNAIDDREYFERFHKVGQEVKNSGGILLQENVVNHRAGSVDALKRMKEYLNGDVGFCLDIKQSIRGGYSPFEVLDAVGENVRHIHISDHDKKCDCKLLLKGDFDFKSFFVRLKELNYSEALIFEVYRNAYLEYGEVFESFNKFTKLYK